MGSPTATIFTRSKMPWVRLPEDSNRVFEESYKFKEVWGEESLSRLQALMPKIKGHQRETFGKELPFEERWAGNRKGREPGYWRALVNTLLPGLEALYC
jgi:hypothetical protein